MAHSKQAKKRIRTSEKAREQNKVVATRMRTAVKKVLRAETAEEAGKALPEAMKRVDKAAKKGVLHANAAARSKSRLSKAVAKLGS
jgi:small subunit ribosomal protein S20